MTTLPHARALPLVLLPACGLIAVDGTGDPCFEAPTAVPGDLVVEVMFSGGEQAPQGGMCRLVPSEDGPGFTLETFVTYERDRSPFTSQSILTLQTVTCTVTLTEPGPLQITFGDEVFTLDVPGDGEPVCPGRVL
jgi:hypothetical protein